MLNAALTLLLTLGAVPAERLIDLTAMWEVSPKPIVWGFHNLYNPCVIYEPGKEYPFKMWFFGWPVGDVDKRFTGDAIFFARAKSLEEWEVYAGDAGWERGMNAVVFEPVMTGTPKPFDGMANGDPSVVKRDGVYYMALSSVGFDNRKDAEGKEHQYNVGCVLGATSKDGIHWKKTEAPIAIWDKELEHGWEIVNGRIPPAAPDYYGSYHRPSLMFDEGKWKLWFDYFVPGTFVSLGYAENKGDFVNPSDWHVLRAGTEPLLRDWPNPCIVKARDKYFSVCDAPNYPDEMGGDGRLLTFAMSSDGLNWKVLGHARPDGKAASHVPQALVMTVDGVEWLYVFYSWKPGQRPGEPWDFRYKEIRHMRCRVNDLIMLN